MHALRQKLEMAFVHTNWQKNFEFKQKMSGRFLSKELCIQGPTNTR